MATTTSVPDGVPPHLDDAAGDLYETALLALVTLAAQQAYFRSKPRDHDLMIAAMEREKELKQRAAAAIAKAWNGDAP